MLKDILQQLEGQQATKDSESHTEIILPFELRERYENIQPIPVISWSAETYEFDVIYDLTRKYSMGYYKPVAQILYEAAKYGPGAGYIVEVGTQYGHGTCLLASGSKAFRREKVITIDDDRGEVRSLYSNEFWERHPVASMRFEMNCLLMGVQDWIIPIGASSRWASENLNIKIRVLYIDASHTYNSCSSDILFWKDKIIIGGLVIFHDYDYPDVKKSVNDYIIESDEFTDIVEITPQLVITQKRGINIDAKSACNNSESDG